MFSPDLLDRFTTHLKEALQKALGFTVTNGRAMVEPGDLVVGLLHEKGSIGAELLQKAGLRTPAAESAFRGTPDAAGPVVTPDLTSAVKRIIEKCVLIAHLNEHKYIGTEHLLAAILASDDPTLAAFLDIHLPDRTVLREQVENVLRSTSRFPDLAAVGEMDEPEEGIGLQQTAPRPQPGRQNATRGSALEAFSRDLTSPEAAERLDPVIGREPELGRVIEILCRRTKNNPVLLGDPGVGKTAIVEGLATRLAAGDVPDALYGKKLLSLDLALTVAGTMYRGEFEARLKQIVDEAKRDPNVILFIDEIHCIVGAGSTTGSLDAANILKPALSRGEIRCIGATTWAEYKKHIEPDAALERRFQPVTVEEPTPDAAFEMLKGLEERYASHHRVRYAPDALRVAVDLADRYLTDRLFPDKVIDLIDEAAASVIARRQSRESMERLSALDVAISAAHEAKETAVRDGRLEDGVAATDDIARLEAERGALDTALRKEQERAWPSVTAEDVARVVARISGVPLSTILASERTRLASLETHLRERVVGQDAAVRDLADIVRRSRLGLGDPRRPKASILLAGPSGTGKTELAHALALELFGREDALVKLDMSEFSEGHTVSKLVGSPAGYVGYRESTRLTDAIRKRPHCVVLFDEFEKAHPDVQNILLQVLEDGRLTDGTGRPVSLRQSYVLLTSNVGSDQLGRKSLGFGEDTDPFGHLVRQELATRFRPELLNRLDRILVFNPLEREHLKEILRREIDGILRRLRDTQRVACTAGDDVLEWLLSRPLPPEEGARAIRRLVERESTAAITRLLTDRPTKRTSSLRASAKKLHVT
ncbi:ATP-dependent Clp protease ATP-binding subunit [Candidatus Uhrbacteria bacterium]|nr:ATP-dependent Clp protease ATP-binding subunit [Candidatus Uhrbacteria bacterium]